MAVSRKVIPTSELKTIVVNMANKIYNSSQSQLLNIMSNLFRQIIFEEFIKASSVVELDICNRIVAAKLQKTFLIEISKYNIWTDDDYYDRITLEFTPPLYFTNTFIEVLNSNKIKNLNFEVETNDVLKLKNTIDEYQQLNVKIKEFKKSSYEVLSKLKTYDKILKEFPEINEFLSPVFKFSIDDSEKKSQIDAIRNQLNVN